MPREENRTGALVVVIKEHRKVNEYLHFLYKFEKLAVIFLLKIILDVSC